MKALWYRAFAGPGFVRDSINPFAQRWRDNAARVSTARCRISAIQSS